MSAITQNKWFKSLLILLGCLAMALFVSFQLSKGSETQGIAIPISYFFPFLFYDFLGWGAIILFMPRFCRRLQERIHSWSWLFLTHLLLGILFSTAHLIVIHRSWIYLMNMFVGTAANSYPVQMNRNLSPMRVVLKWLDYDLLIYMAIVGFVYFHDYYNEIKEKEIKTSQLNAQLAQAQLQALRIQLQPHFLFNVLNTVSAYVYENPDTAVKMIAYLSKMLRFSFSSRNENEITLEEELRLLSGYLEIERIRFQDRLRITLRIDPHVNQALVPTMLLQPLVENAVRHGIAQKTTGGEIVVSARSDSGRLRIVVSDSGPGFQGDSEQLFTRGVGLRNTRERLRMLYGERHGLKIGDRSRHGFRVEISLPLNKVDSTKRARAGT
jgi:two-component system LytT family sensor kinase